jgi:hypothetical protein
MTSITDKPGLLATIFPDGLVQFSLSFGSFTNCFTFMQGFDDNFVSGLSVETLRPETLGWTNLRSREEWLVAVSNHFSPSGIPAQRGSSADREGEDDMIHKLYSCSINYYNNTGLNFDAPFVNAICVPKISGALDYHFAVFNGIYWLEQAGHGGPLNIWKSQQDMMNDIYRRTNLQGQYLYVRNSAFVFKKRIDI